MRDATFQGPVKPFLVYLHLKTEKCMQWKTSFMKGTSVHIERT